ncbi:MAG: hypothetical protein WC471_06140 [Candidatus Woesearchaeota archaeon]|jgi:hypothetical protein
MNRKEKFILTLVLGYFAILVTTILFSFPVKAALESGEEVQNATVLSCVLEEKLIRIYPSGVQYFITGMNGNPDGMVAVDVDKVIHVIYFTKDSPYKCSLTEETEL